MAREMKGEIALIRRLRDEVLESAGLAANPPQGAAFDRPDEGDAAKEEDVVAVEVEAPEAAAE